MLEYLKKIMFDSEASFNRELNILVIEDSKLYSMVLKKYLLTSLINKNISTNVILTENSDEAIKTIVNNSPDIILMDFSLGGASVDGLELIKEIRKIDSESQLMVLTNRFGVDIANQCYKFGANNYIHKERDDFKGVVDYIINIIDYNSKKSNLNL